ISTSVWLVFYFFFFSSRRRHTRWPRDWSSDVCSSDLPTDATSTVPKVASVGPDPSASPDPRITGFRVRALSAGTSYIRITGLGRSEERRVGKEWRSRWSPGQQKKKNKTNDELEISIEE